MKTDSFFYRIFQTLPEIFFTLTDFGYCASDYEFQAVEIEQWADRLLVAATLEAVFSEIAH